MATEKVEQYYMEQAKRLIKELGHNGYLSDTTKGSKKKRLIKFMAGLLLLHCDKAVTLAVQLIDLSKPMPKKSTLKRLLQRGADKFNLCCTANSFDYKIKQHLENLIN